MPCSWRAAFREKIIDCFTEYARVDYIRQHVGQCELALRAGLPLRGYFYWSVMDCWEASMGYGYPMGLIAVNFQTLERVPRDSFYYYQKLIKNGGIE